MCVVVSPGVQTLGFCSSQNERISLCDFQGSSTTPPCSPPPSKNIANSSRTMLSGRRVNRWRSFHGNGAIACLGGERRLLPGVNWSRTAWWQGAGQDGFWNVLQDVQVSAWPATRWAAPGHPPLLCADRSVCLVNRLPPPPGSSCGPGSPSQSLSREMY